MDDVELTPEIRCRARGTLLGMATGDCLGVPYEFGSAPFHGQPELIGGGLGDYEPGEWSDDTQMALCIAPVSYTHLTLPTILRSCRSRWSPYH